jgi:CubicO group peptidase (beta-lactamase class C family)
LKVTLAFEPNSQHKYSNSNYNLLGYIIEDITGKSYVDNLNSRIIKKLGLKNTALAEKIDVSKNEGYSFSFDGKVWEKVQNGIIHWLCCWCNFFNTKRFDNVFIWFIQ